VSEKPAAGRDHHLFASEAVKLIANRLAGGMLVRIGASYADPDIDCIGKPPVDRFGVQSDVRRRTRNRVYYRRF
jgi:hypothetical protein